MDKRIVRTLERLTGELEALQHRVPAAEGPVRERLAAAKSELLVALRLADR